MDWQAWHEDYETPDSALGRRLEVVQAQIRAALDRVAPGPVRIISVCAGQGHDLSTVWRRHQPSACRTATVIGPQRGFAAFSARKAYP